MMGVWSCVFLCFQLLQKMILGPGVGECGCWYLGGGGRGIPSSVWISTYFLYSDEGVCLPTFHCAQSPCSGATLHTKPLVFCGVHKEWCVCVCVSNFPSVCSHWSCTCFLSYWCLQFRNLSGLCGRSCQVSHRFPLMQAACSVSQEERHALVPVGPLFPGHPVGKAPFYTVCSAKPCRAGKDAPSH